MVLSILSLLLYLGIFAWGILIDKRKSSSEASNDSEKKIYLVVLYVFLCFGYMVGSDWRSYEDDFYHTSFGDYTYDIAFQFLFSYSKYLIPDYFLVVGIFKCFYLYSLTRLLKEITPYWVSTTAILMPISLCFMLIDNPLRFMIALIFVNYGFISYFRKKYMPMALLFFVSIFFHSSCAFVLSIFLLSLFFADKIGKVNSWILVLEYVVVYVITLNQDFIMSIAEGFSLFATTNLGSKDYGYYFDDISSDNAYAIGNLLKIVAFAVLVLFHGKTKDDKWESFIYGMTIISMYMDRFVIMIPAGMRLVIPLQYFYGIYLTYLVLQKKRYVLIVLAIIVVSWTRNLWIDYRYIPYTNSIPYILTGHKPYQERFNFNYIEQKERSN